MSDNKTQNPTVDAAELYSEVPKTPKGTKRAEELGPDVRGLIDACANFARVLTRKAQGAHPDRNKPFACYTMRESGSPRIPDRESAEAITHYTATAYRQIGGPSIRLKVAQLPDGHYGVFAFKSGTKRRFKLADGVSF